MRDCGGLEAYKESPQIGGNDSVVDVLGPSSTAGSREGGFA